MPPMNPSLLWLIAGLLLCSAEALIGPGMGLFFGGLAAVIVGLLTEIGVVGKEAYVAQGAWWLVLTVVLAAALWKPLKNFYTHRNTPGRQYNNIVGGKATVAGEGLRKGMEGQVAWSGTLMKAELAADAAESVPAGAPVTIVGMQGAKLIVK